VRGGIEPDVIGRLVVLRGAAALVAITVAVAACSSGDATSSAGPTAEPGALRVVATTSVLADLVAHVAGTKASVVSLVPKGGEVHTFDPTPQDIARVSEAQLIVSNGLGLDEWLTTLASDAGARNTPKVALGENLDGVTYLTGDGAAEAVNPHLWLNVGYARRYVARISQELARADPADAARYAANAARYDAELAALDTAIRTRIAAIPAANRKIVSLHEAFPYFAAAYGLTIVGVVVSVPGQDPSASQLAELVRVIRETRAKAVFGEAQFSDKLARTVADESGATVESNLYSDTLGDPPADSYVGMMRSNADRIVAALGGA
jgi:ABC-type Zn uptake system ZnuABC Zn-binding protein ZnuA